MAKPKAWYVSQLTTEDASGKDGMFKDAHHYSQFDSLMAAVGNALRDVEFHRTGPNSAVVYRKGDIFALGEIGYKNTKSKGNGELTYYVQSRRIENDKYRDSSWQHHIVATKVLKTAVTAASTYLVPFNCEEAVGASRDTARQLITDQMNKCQTKARDAYKRLTGESGYSTNMESEFILELRGHKFISPKLNAASEDYYAAYDEWKDAVSATKGGVYYLGISDNYGQQVADMAHVDMGWPYAAICLDRMPAESVADWVKGRVAVLSMVEPLKYVQGVGLRLDDRTFYVVGDKERE